MPLSCFLTFSSSSFLLAQFLENRKKELNHTQLLMKQSKESFEKREMELSQISIDLQKEAKRNVQSIQDQEQRSQQRISEEEQRLLLASDQLNEMAFALEKERKEQQQILNQVDAIKIREEKLQEKERHQQNISNQFKNNLRTIHALHVELFNIKKIKKMKKNYKQNMQNEDGEKWSSEEDDDDQDPEEKDVEELIRGLNDQELFIKSEVMYRQVSMSLQNQTKELKQQKQTAALQLQQQERETKGKVFIQNAKKKCKKKLGRSYILKKSLEKIIIYASCK